MSGAGGVPAVVNLADKLSRIGAHWSPRIVAEMNEEQFKLARLHGAFIWHAHDDTDETFIVLKGRLRIEFRDGHADLAAGEMIVVPRGVEHRPVADGECHVLLVEPRGTVNTGNAGGPMTAATDAWI